jgi:hypothetical protein
MIARSLLSGVQGTGEAIAIGIRLVGSETF